jgi:glycosyltransferase involved in cell wall biosynthesis
VTRLLAVFPAPAWSVEARVQLDLLVGLARRGVGVVVATPRGGTVAQAAEAAGLPVTPHEPGEAGWLRHGGLLAEAMVAHDVDALLVGDEATHLAAARAVRQAGRGVIFRRVPTGAPLARSLRTRVAARLAPTWLVHATAADAEGSARIATVRGRVVAPLGVDGVALRRVPPLAAPLGVRTLVLVVDRDARRATSAAIRAVAALRRHGHPWRVVVLGTPHDENELRVHATAVGLGDACAVVGAPPVTAALVGGADIVWVVADHDAGGVAVLEAMALGRPLLVARGTLGERFVDHPHTARVVDKDDALANAALLAALEPEAVRAALGAAARRVHDDRAAVDEASAALADALQRALRSVRAAA